MILKRTASLCLAAPLITVLLAGSAAACAANKDLLQQDEIDTALALSPCDPIGALYLDGLSGDRFFSFTETQKLDPQHVFYGFARTYLNALADLPDAETPFADFDAAYASLIMATHLLDRTTGADDQRRTAYSAYAKLAYAQFADLRGTGESMLISAIEEEITSTKLSGLRGLHCFVLHDMPDVSANAVIASKAYQSCVAAQN